MAFTDSASTIPACATARRDTRMHTPVRVATDHPQAD